MEGVGSEVITDLVTSGLSYRAIGERLQELYPDITRGLSWQTVHKYCTANGLRTVATREIVTDEELDESVARVLSKVCIICLAIYVRFNRV